MDDVVVTIMELDRAIRNGSEETGESIYNERGLLFI